MFGCCNSAITSGFTHIPAVGIPGDFSVLLKAYCIIFAQRKKQDALYSRNTNKTLRAAPPEQMSFDTSTLSLRGGCRGRGVTCSDPVGMAPETLCQPLRPAAQARPEQEHLPHHPSCRCCSMPPASSAPSTALLNCP